MFRPSCIECGGLFVIDLSVCLLQQKDAQNADFQVMCNSSANAHIKKTLEISVTFQ